MTDLPTIPTDLIERVEMQCHTCDAGCDEGCREDDVERVLRHAWPELYALAARSAGGPLQRMAAERLESHGAHDARGAAIWDCARWLLEGGADNTTP